LTFPFVVLTLSWLPDSPATVATVTRGPLVRLGDCVVLIRV